jgi:hypothetical protein
MIMLEQIVVLLDRIQSGGGEESSLTHTTAESFTPNSRPVDVVG